MVKKYVIVGGAGLLGTAIAKEAVRRKEDVVIIDMPKKILSKKEKIPGVTYRGEDVLKKNVLRSCMKELKPDVLINAINVATIFSHDTKVGYDALIKFYVTLYGSILDLRKPLHYIQMGTTGAGGLGFNIPFTHGAALEDLPIIHKAAFSGMTTSLLTMLSRSYGGDIKVSEIKPGLAIFSDVVQVEKIGDGVAVTADGGESGPYTYNELALLTARMGFTTADCIAKDVLAVIEGKKAVRRLSAYDITEVLNATIVSPVKGDEHRRQVLMKGMKHAAGKSGVIATGSLGPPSITRDLIIGHAILNKLQVSVDHHFFEVLQLDTAIRATCAYIKLHNSELFSYLQKECTYERYQQLSLQFKKQREAWQFA